MEETRYLLFLAKDLEYIGSDKEKELEEKTEKVSKMLNGLIKSLKKG